MPDPHNTAPTFHGEALIPWDECPVCHEELVVSPIPADNGPTRHYYCEHCTYRWDD